MTNFYLSSKTLFDVDRQRQEEAFHSMEEQVDDAPNVRPAYTPEPTYDAPDTAPNVRPWQSDPYSTESLSTPAMPPQQDYYRPLDAYADRAVGNEHSAMSLFDVGAAPRGLILGGLQGKGANVFSDDISAYRGIDTPGIRDLPDSGITAGPFHITPRTVAGFALDTAADPTSYLPTPIVDDAVRMAGGLAKRGIGALERQGAEDAVRRAAPEAFQYGHRALDDTINTTREGVPHGGVFDYSLGGTQAEQVGDYSVTGRTTERRIPTAAGRERDAAQWSMSEAQPGVAGASPEEDILSIGESEMSKAGLEDADIALIKKAQAGEAEPADRQGLMTALSKVFQHAKDDSVADASAAAGREAAEMGHAPAAASANDRYKEMERVRQQYASERLPQASAEALGDDLSWYAQQFVDPNLGSGTPLRNAYTSFTETLSRNELVRGIDAARAKLQTRIDTLASGASQNPNVLKEANEALDWLNREYKYYGGRQVSGGAELPGQSTPDFMRRPTGGSTPSSGTGSTNTPVPQGYDAAGYQATQEAERQRLFAQSVENRDAGIAAQQVRGGMSRPPRPNLDLPGGGSNVPPGGPPSGVVDTVGGSAQPPRGTPYDISQPSEEIPDWITIASRWNKSQLASAGAGAVAGGATGDDPSERFQHALAGAVVGYSGYRAAKRMLTPQGGLKGPLYNKLQDVVRGKPNASMAPVDLEDIHTFIRATAPDEQVAMTADAAMTKLMIGEPLVRSDWDALKAAFGRDIDALGRAYEQRPIYKDGILQNPPPTTRERIATGAVDLLNLPRTVKSSWDASAPFRQGVMLMAGHPIRSAQSAGLMLKAMASDEAAQAVAQRIKNSPNAALYEKHGLYIAPLDGSLNAREEAFTSKLAEWIPGTRISERGYVTYLNSLRTSIFDDVAKSWHGVERTDKDWKDLTTFINAASGRGSWPKEIADFAPIMNAAFFSPRFFISRFEAHAALFRSSPAVRGMVAKDLAAFYGMNMAILGLVAASGVGGVELRPESADFGKGHIGNFRYDFLGGNQQIMRTTAQLATGHRISTATNEREEVPRTEVMENFLRSKLAPLPGAAVDLKTGRDTVGHKVTPESVALNLVAPIFQADISQALQDEGYKGGFMVTPGLLGVGVQEYGSTPMDRVSPGNDFWALDKSVQEQLKELHPDIWEKQVAQGSESFERAEARRTEYKAYQQADDRELIGNPAYIDTWKDNLADRTIELGARVREIYVDRAPSKARNIAQEYTKHLGEWRTDAGKPDWDRVEEWRASLTTRENEYIDSEVGIGSTPAVKDYRKTGHELRQTGFYTDTREKPWEMTKEVIGIDGGNDFYAWKQRQTSDVMKILKDAEVPPGAALTLATQTVDKLPAVKTFEHLKKQAELQFAVDYPDLTDRAAQYRYTSLSKDEIKAVLAGKSR